MKYIVVSDNHADRKSLLGIIDTYYGKSTAIFHCGDSELPSNDDIWRYMIPVSGNCDYSDDYPVTEVARFGPDTIVMTHGHHYNVKAGIKDLKQLAKEKKANIVLYGHTHALATQYENHVLFVNPGSIRLPRGVWDIPTYAVIDSEEKGYTVTYYDQNQKPVEGLTFTFPR